MSRRITLTKPPVVEVEHVSTSASVNPRYRITFADGSSYLTGKDSAVAYTITNSDYREGDVIIEVEGGDLVTIRRADESAWTSDSEPTPIVPGETGEDGALGGWKSVHLCPGHAGTAHHRIEVEAIVIDGRQRFDHDGYNDGFPYDVLVVTSRMHGSNCMAVETEWPLGSALASEADALAQTRRIIDSIRPDSLSWIPEGGN